MTEIYIKYNPYTVETEFKINNEPIRENSTFAAQGKKRLQYWLERSDNNWNGIVDELKKATNDSELKITFEGRKIDFEDLKITVEKNKKDENNKDLTIELIHIETKNDKEILKKIDGLIDVINNGSIKELKSEEVKNAYEEVKSSKFKVNVIATMSSGKSTLINSFIGYELLPSENQACTATIARITDNDDFKEFIAECRDENENIIYEKKAVELKDIQNYNEDENVTYIDIEGPIPGISSENMNLLIVDTPGPNNSRNTDHGKLTKSIIEDKNKGIVLYVINATQFGINDDNNLLEMIAEAMKKGGKQSKDRFIFAINKCDEFDCEKKESIDKLLTSVKQYLLKYKIEDPNLFPVSAQTAKLIRMYQNDKELTRKEKKDLSVYKDFIELEGYHFDKMASLSESCRINLKEKLEAAKENGDEYEEALIHTGIPAIEEAINEYLEKYAYPIKIKDAVSELKSISGQMQMEMKLDEEIAKDSKKYEEVRIQIENANEKKRRGQGAQRLKKRIENFGIDDSKFKSIEKDVLLTFDKITRKYNNIKEIEESIAKIEINKFKKDIEGMQRTLEINLNSAIQDSVINQGEKLVKKYKEYLETLKAELKIDGFNFEKVRSIQKININDVDNLVENYERTEDIMQSKRVQNTDKRWYKPWTWGESEYYTVNEKVGEKKLVNVEELIKVSMSKIQNQVDKNIKASKVEGKERVIKLKEYFENELNKLDKLMADIIDDLNKKTASREQIIARVKENQAKKIWIDDVIKKIDNIMNI
ncbi:dynamin family protein [Clostridium uliginosum]|uniref:Dynamin family protein n=1 Tax=Clostridium uliginosum TaxID=119641 RepID=A0A1I1NW49_9CLOT|nr:dynamin family protein [Clostridium uliginosum]SFC99718.1 Dynamin family protein [Clostridium uliginosum]